MVQENSPSKLVLHPQTTSSSLSLNKMFATMSGSSFSSTTFPLTTQESDLESFATDRNFCGAESDGCVCAATEWLPNDSPKAIPATKADLPMNERRDNSCSRYCSSASQRGQVPSHSPLNLHLGISSRMPFSLAIWRRIDFNWLQTNLPGFSMEAFCLGDDCSISFIKHLF